MQDWQHLGLDGPSTDLARIKRAYAKRLRSTRPDDDAQAYQALREAYDRLVQRARRQAAMQPQPQPQPITAEVLGQWQPVTAFQTSSEPGAEPALGSEEPARRSPPARLEQPVDAPAPARSEAPTLPPAESANESINKSTREAESEPRAEAVPKQETERAEADQAPPPASAPVPVQSATPTAGARSSTAAPQPAPASLSLDDIEQHLQALLTRGRAATEAWLPELSRQLHLLPLSRHADASARMADLVLRERGLPESLLCLLSDHFAWLDDFRTARQIGAGRAEALHDALDGLERSCTDPHVLARYAETLSLHRMLAQGQDRRAWLLTLLMRPLLLKQLASAGPPLLKRLGLDVARQRRIAKLLADAETWQIAGTSILIFGLALLLSQHVYIALATLGVSLVLGLPGLYLLNTLCQVLFNLRSLTKMSEASSQRWDASRWRPARPWVGIALAAAGLAALALAPYAPRQPLGAIGFLVSVLGVWLALPDTQEQMPVAAALWVYLLLSLQLQFPLAAALLMLWVLAGVKLNLYRQWRIGWLEGTRRPFDRYSFELALLLTIGLPVLVSRLVEVVGWKRVMCALALAATPLYLEMRFGDLTRWFATPGLLVGALSLLALSRSAGLRLGQRLLRSRFGAPA